MSEQTTLWLAIIVNIGRTHKFFSHVISKDNESFDYEKLYKQKSFKKILYT